MNDDEQLVDPFASFQADDNNTTSFIPTPPPVNTAPTEEHTIVDSIASLTDDNQNQQNIKITSNQEEDINIIQYQKNIDIIALVDQIFTDAILQTASDIHIEPFEQVLLVRFRVDGDFILYRNFAPEFSAPILTRIEVLAGLKLDKNRLPQDGKISFDNNEQRVDLRVSTFPTMWGNKIVIRLLIKDDKVQSLSSLGYDKHSQEKIMHNLNRTYGMVLMTGPTGSGKSTSLFAMLSSYDPFKKNISTLEDPVEYFIPGVNQSQVNAEIGYDFPEGLRTLVRQDPDIIMVGEIRDKTTAKLAINAAITGHLVFSTLHANSASATVQRLMNMDVDHFLVVSALNLIVSQRLVRRICSHCKQEIQINEQTLEMVKTELLTINENTDNLVFYQGTGCEKCKESGYKGRVGIYELLEMTPEISNIIIEKKAVAEDVQKIAVEQGMITIKQNGIKAALRGETSLEEVLIASDAFH